MELAWVKETLNIPEAPGRKRAVGNEFGDSNAFRARLPRLAGHFRARLFEMAGGIGRLPSWGGCSIQALPSTWAYLHAVWRPNGPFQFDVSGHLGPKVVRDIVDWIGKWKLD